VIEDDMTGRETEVLGLLGTFCEDLAKIQKEHDAAKTKPAFDKYDKDGSGAIDREELAQLSADLGSPLDED
jgi:Ca2+-binding EF-hand superfamily protein